MKNREFHFDTLQVHGGYFTPESTTNSRAVPIYQTTAYTFNSAEHGANLFELKEFGNIYTRLMNPTTDIFEKRMAALEKGVAALAVASGHSAQVVALLNILEAGDNFVTSPFLYGGTHNQFRVTFKRMGIEARFAQDDTVQAIEPLIDSKTKAIYVENIGNPTFNVPDFNALVAMCRKHDLPLIVDNTFAGGGYLCQPIAYGANIVVESATKWIGGHGNSMGGVIIDGGNYNWGNGKFPQFSEPSAGYHGLIFWERFGNLSFIIRARVEGLRDLGPAISPFNSFELIQGLETLSVRMERICKNTLRLANWLSTHPKIYDVQYIGLPNNKYFNLANQYLKNGFGGVLCFRVKGGYKNTVQFVESLKMISHLVNVGDVRTIITHPASTTHQQLSVEDQERAGIYPDLLRLSVGLEHISDIQWDINQAFDSIDS